MSERFFLERLAPHALVELTGPEAHHLLHVMRAQPGDAVVLFDGRGGESRAIVESLRRDAVRLQTASVNHVDRECAAPIELAAALPKGDRQKWLVEKAVEMGVRRLVPLETARAVAQPTGSALDRLRRSVVEASKQCGRNRLMEIGEPRSIDGFLTGAHAAAGESNGARWFAHPGGEPLARAIHCGGEAFTIAVGPEGGFTAEELECARRSGWRIIDLGPRILRVETAALLLAAAAQLSSTD